MSTEFITVPRIPYQEFLKKCEFEGQGRIELSDPEKQVYIARHKRLKINGVFVWAYEDVEGNVQFERFGDNPAEQFFPTIIELFGVQVFDEYGSEIKLEDDRG